MITGFGYAHFTRGAANAQAMTFFIATFAQLFFSFACRSHRHIVPRLGIFTNPYLLVAIALSALLQLGLLCFGLTQHLFFTKPPQFGLDWIVIFSLALVPVSVVEIGKLITNRGTPSDLPPND